MFIGNRRVKGSCTDMLTKLFLFATIGVAWGATYFDHEEIAAAVKQAKASWIAGDNFNGNVSVEHLKRLCGTKITGHHSKSLPVKTVGAAKAGSKLPDHFDSRQKWTKCQLIGKPRDQGTCGSCWAVAAASTMTDRVCIATNGVVQSELSANELLSCCDYCGEGCDGGYLEYTWLFLRDHGLVTGGAYRSHTGCQPYQIQPCEHHTKGSRPSCSDLPSAKTPTCSTTCLNIQDKEPNRLKHYKMASAYTIASDEEKIRREIYENGPVEAAFTVYADFAAYKSGVYHHVTGDELGGHAVKIIGWGMENSVPYWLVVNSWNSDWGEKGLFKIRRGNDECGFESDITFGIYKN